MMAPLMLLFEIRAKLTEIYQKYDFIIKTVLRFLLMFFAFSKISKVVGYNTSLSGKALIIALAVFSAFLPPSLMVFAAVLYVFLQILTASVLIAVTVMMIFLVLYLFFLRFTPKEGLAVIATPVLMSFGFPYLVPLFLGMFGSVLSVVPAACGVVAFYILRAVRNNIITIEEIKAMKDQALQIYMDILDDFLKNPQMYVVIAVFAVVIIIVVMVRAIRMDYAFEISLGVGTGVMILGYIIGSLKYEMDFTIGGMLFGSLISMGIVFLCLFFYRVLNYSAVERVQFEDERYYYYVTAVPKITTGTPKKAIRKILAERREEDDASEEGEEEAIEAMESMLSGKRNRKPLSASLAKRLRKDVAPKQEDYAEDEDDEEDEVVIKGPKAEQSGLALLKTGFDKLKSFLPKKDKKPRVRHVSDEEEDEDEAVPSYFAEPSEEPGEPEESDKREEDEDYE